jgi:hypothetical protein
MSTLITNEWSLIAANSGALIQKFGNETLYVAYTDGEEPISGSHSVFVLKSSSIQNFEKVQDKSIWIKASRENLHVTYEILG